MPTRQPRYLGDFYEEEEIYLLDSWNLPGLTRKPPVNRRRPCQKRTR